MNNQFTSRPKVEGGTCEKCGAKLVKNPKTGKIFCEKKCWLNPTTANFETARAIQNEMYPEKTKEPDWDKIAFGKIKYGFLLEGYKAELMSMNGKINWDNLEQIAEEGAKRSMRVLGEPSKAAHNNEVFDQPPF